MPATDLFSQNPLAGPDAVERLASRIRALGREVPARVRERIVALIDESTRDTAARDTATRDTETLRDAVSTRLMEAFRDHQSRGCFGLLYELNGAQLLVQVAARLRRYSCHADPGDVLQEVFFNVYRYPHRFDSTRDDAFRVWSAMIVRNTVLKHLRSLGRSGRLEVSFGEAGEPEIRDDVSPLSGVLQEEESRACRRTYITYLQLYLRLYSRLSERERRALQLVEVDRISYRDAADALDLKLENLKMVIFRARRKIHRAMQRVFEGLPPEGRGSRALDLLPDVVSPSADEARR